MGYYIGKDPIDNLFIGSQQVDRLMRGESEVGSKGGYFLTTEVLGDNKSYTITAYDCTGKKMWTSQPTTELNATRINEITFSGENCAKDTIYVAATYVGVVGIMLYALSKSTGDIVSRENIGNGEVYTEEKSYSVYVKYYEAINSVAVSSFVSAGMENQIQVRWYVRNLTTNNIVTMRYEVVDTTEQDPAQFVILTKNNAAYGISLNKDPWKITMSQYNVSSGAKDHEITIGVGVNGFRIGILPDGHYLTYDPGLQAIGVGILDPLSNPNTPSIASGEIVSTSSWDINAALSNGKVYAVVWDGANKLLQIDLENQKALKSFEIPGSSVFMDQNNTLYVPSYPEGTFKIDTDAGNYTKIADDAFYSCTPFNYESDTQKFVR